MDDYSFHLLLGDTSSVKNLIKLIETKFDVSSSTVPTTLRFEFEGIYTCLSFRDQLWSFEYWQKVPGPGENDIACDFHSLSEALNVVCNFYRGSPTIIESWIVPFHTHPELSEVKTRQAITEAVNVSQEMFLGIAERRREKIFGNKFFGETRWQWATQYQFLKIEHRFNKEIELRLRRDMLEAYIVHL